LFVRLVGFCFVFLFVFVAYRTLTSTNIDILRTTAITSTHQHETCSSYKSDYLAIQRLITHTDQMSIDDLFHYSLTAYFLSEMTKLTGFLSLASNTADNNEQILLGSILLKHIQQMICNAQTISITETNQNITNMLEQDKSNHDEHESLNRRFASAIFPTCALMNHSCLPNIRCVYDQGYLHVQSARWIRQGEEILNCYGPQKSLMPSNQQRRNILFEQYFVS
jgi:hypothetical protein